MKRVFTISFFAILFCMQSCKKDVEGNKPQIADLEFKLSSLKIDGIVSDINYPSTLILKADYTWTLDLSGAKSYGTYTWKPTESYRAQPKFTILQWTPLPADTLLSNKLKNVIQIVDGCGFPGPTIVNLNFFDSTYTTTLITFKK